MNFKEEFNKEMQDLQNVKRPYESFAFFLFALLLLQQLVYLFISFYKFAFDPAITWFSTANIFTSNLMAWVPRIINMGTGKWLYVLLGLVAYVGYYAIIYFFVWNYAKKRNLAKWTWTLIVVFLPVNIFFAPGYIWFVIYAFWPYITRFIKRVYIEFKQFNPDHTFPEEEPEVSE